MTWCSNREYRKKPIFGQLRKQIGGVLRGLCGEEDKLFAVKFEAPENPVERVLQAIKSPSPTSTAAYRS